MPSLLHREDMRELEYNHEEKMALIQVFQLILINEERMIELD